MNVNVVATWNIKINIPDYSSSLTVCVKCPLVSSIHPHTRSRWCSPHHMPFNNMKLQLFSMSRGALAKFTTVKLIKASSKSITKIKSTTKKYSDFNNHHSLNEKVGLL
ncbi:hypothetical protein [Methanobacterium sp.]|uniref:hypothetical protein n=1 Tax=Methanobacterium sp. TaxID=2164 RepID=UPI0025E3AEA7|nr:hypothetical protein [Methanobacterium sp.]MBI5458100.1 hypothetical protein [Methanobacterium sp.]